ncbi:hypothetical protein C2E23DRAFT_883520 [Lenzites betulinus]|nr:hypothetical protein C2E23DRAFT_883520 [Lenzites betulinus]
MRQPGDYLAMMTSSEVPNTRQWLIDLFRFLLHSWKIAIVCFISLCIGFAIAIYFTPYAGTMRRARSTIERAQRIAKEIDALLEETRSISSASHGALMHAIELLKAKDTENKDLRYRLSRGEKEWTRAREERQRRTFERQRELVTAQRSVALDKAQRELEKANRELEEVRGQLAERDAALASEKERYEELEARWEEMRERLRDAVEESSPLTGTLCDEWADPYL